MSKERKSVVGGVAGMCGTVGAWGAKTVLRGMLSAGRAAVRCVFPESVLSFHGFDARATGTSVLRAVLKWGNAQKITSCQIGNDAYVLGEMIRTHLLPAIQGGSIPINNRDLDAKAWERIREILGSYRIPWHIV